MIIGTVRPEEARVFDSEAGYHQFHNESGDAHGSFEVFWHDGKAALDAAAPEPDGEDWDHDDSETVQPAGWYWRSCFPGCLPDGDAFGPFATSRAAMYDADDFHPDNMEETE